MSSLDVFCSKIRLLGDVVVRAANNRVLTTTKNGVISLYDSSTGARLEVYDTIKVIGDYFECRVGDETQLLDNKLSIIDRIRSAKIKYVIDDRYLILVSVIGNRMSVKLIGSRYIIDGPLNNCKAYRIKDGTKDSVAFLCSWPNGETTIETCSNTDNKCKRIIELQSKLRVILGYSQYCIIDAQGKYRIYEYTGKLKLSLLKPGIEIDQAIIDNKGYIIVKSFKNEVYRFLAAYNYN